jgi:hypothetical protein
MKSRRLPLLLALLAPALCLIAASCTRPNKSASTWQPPRPVRIEGGKGWMNYNGSWLPWTTEPVNDSAAGLLLRDGDWVVGAASSSFVYRATDGTVLKTTAEETLVRLAGKVVGVSLEKEGSGRAWLETASASELASVRLLALPSEVKPAWLPALTRLAAANRHVDLMVESTPALRQALRLFQPHLLIVKKPDTEGCILVSGQHQLETLFLADGSASDLDFLRRLPRLQRLVLLDTDCEKPGTLFAGLGNLRSLHLTLARSRDLSELGDLPSGLEELSICSAKGTVELRSLAKLTHLRMLSLAGCEATGALAELDVLRQLQWVALPPNITQQQFAAFIAAHRSLRLLELVGCEGVTDLRPLHELRELEGLVLAAKGKSASALLASPQNVGVLRSLKSLRFVGLPVDAFKESPGQIAEIRNALPDALVVPTKPFCLGSGWILLLLPVVMLAGRFGARRRKAVPTTPHHA